MIKWIFSLPEMGAAQVFHSVVWSLMLTVLLYVAIVANGQTFGKRCEKLYPTDAIEKAKCIKKLSKGINNCTEL